MASNQDGTILNTLGATLRSPQTIRNECLAKGLERFKLRQVMRQAEERNQERRQVEIAENRSKAFFSSKIDELEDLSRIFED